MLISIIIYIIVGIATGLLAGLLGIGGGIIIVPSLFFIFHFLNIQIADPMHLAIGTSLAIITLSSLTAMILYQKRHAIFWPIFKYLNISLIISSFFGVLISYMLSGKMLSQIFAVLAFLFGIYLFIFKKVHKRRKKPEKLLVIFTSLIIGFLATLLGVGGGIIGLPFFLMLLMVPNYCLVGTSATATFITSIVGTIGYLTKGSNKIIETHSIGYIYLPAFIIIGVFAIFSTYYGIRLQDRIEPTSLKKTFAIILIITSFFMFLK